MHRVLGCLVALILVACNGAVDFPTPGPSSGQGDAGTPGPAGFDGAIPYPDLSCGSQSIPITLVQRGDIPDLFLVVDRSGSMADPVDIFNWLLSKWQVMSDTLVALVTTYKANIRFGLSLFPSDAVCGAGKIDQPLAADNWAAIQQSLAVGAVGATPTPTTLSAVRTYLVGEPPGKGLRYVLLATDGMPNCGGPSLQDDTSPETLAEVQALAAAGIKTFVVGFGDIILSNPALLDQLAQAGGVPNPKGPPSFYPATNQAELQQALFGIAGGIIPPPCTYALTDPPPDPDNVTVTFDGKPVPRSASSTAGWNYTGNGTEITFFGAACDELRTGSVKEVKFLFGCKGPTIARVGRCRARNARS